MDEKRYGLSRDGLYNKLTSIQRLRPTVFLSPCVRFCLLPRRFGEGSFNGCQRVADGILTLPIYDSLKLDDVDRVCSIIIEAARVQG